MKETDLETMTNEQDITVITLDSQLLNQQYNDLGFMVGRRLIILVEAQSTWSENIVLRVLLYVTWTWFKYIKRNKLDIYDGEKLDLPEPELYVIYTGKGEKPDKVTLSGSIFGGRNTCIDCEVTVLSNGKDGDIISQYVRFCHVFDEQVKTHGRTRKAVEETIRICQSEDVLKEYLERQREEVLDIMDELFERETVIKMYGWSERRKAREDRDREKIETMLRKGLTPEQVADYGDYPIELVHEVEQSMLVTA